MLRDLRSSSDEEWFARIEKLGAKEGFFARLGHEHAALFVKRKPRLIVTFETVESILRRQPDQLPFGLAASEMRDCSHLCVIATQDTWYRSDKIYEFFDGLVDEAFFEDFDHVVFFGAGMAGYAAAAYSVTAPGATVVLLQPQATLDPALTAWDPRFSEHRRLNFNDRYGYAPDMVEGAGQVYVIFDPDQTFDAMHAALFRKSFTTYLPCRNLGSDLFGALSKTHILHSTLAAAISGNFDERLFWTFYRARRNFVPYLNRLLGKLEMDGRLKLAGYLAANVGQRLNDPKFRAKAQELVNKLSAAPRNAASVPKRID